MENALGYYVIVKGFDWGPGNHKIVVAFDCPITVDLSSPFEVEATKTYTDFDFVSKTAHEVTKSELIEVVGAYLSDEFGNKIEQSAYYLTLELKCHPDMPLSNPYNYNPLSGHNTWRGISYNVRQIGSLYDIEGHCIENVTLDASSCLATRLVDVTAFGTGTTRFHDHHYGDITLNYALYKPVSKQNQRPLLVILHGAGEGGNDPLVPLLGNKTSVFAQDHYQAYFGGAYVLVPQAPTMWMDDGGSAYTQDGTSMYTQALMDSIQKTIDDNPDIDRTRIYIGGGSNGGFMTFNMLLNYPKTFAAAFMICAAYDETWVDDANLEKIKDIPMWFVHSKDDAVVPYDTTALQLFKRLIQLGAADTHLTLREHIEDQSGSYYNSDNEPYRYHGHWSWIPVYNDEIVDGTVKLFEWLAQHSQ